MRLAQHVICIWQSRSESYICATIINFIAHLRVALCIRPPIHAIERSSALFEMWSGPSFNRGGSLLNYDCRGARSIIACATTRRCTLIFVVARLGGFNQSPDLMWRHTTCGLPHSMWIKVNRQ